MQMLGKLMSAAVCAAGLLLSGCETTQPLPGENSYYDGKKLSYEYYDSGSDWSVHGPEVSYEFFDSYGTEAVYLSLIKSAKSGVFLRIRSTSIREDDKNMTHIQMAAGELVNLSSEDRKKKTCILNTCVFEEVAYASLSEERHLRGGPLMFRLNADWGAYSFVLPADYVKHFVYDLGSDTYMGLPAWNVKIPIKF